MKKNQIVKLIKKILGWPLSLIALFFLVKIIAPKTILLLPHFKQINFLGLFFGIMCFIAYLLLRGITWRNILKLKGYFIPLKEAIFLWGFSELKRYVPGGIWSFLGRTISFNDKGIAKKEIFHFLIIEVQLIIIGSLFLSIFSFSLFKELPLSLLHKQIITIIVFLITITFIFHKYLFKHFNLKIMRFLLPNLNARNSFFLLTLSIATFFFFGLGTYLTTTSLFYLSPEDIMGYIGFFVFSLLIGYLSIITPMGLGVREGIMTAGLAKIVTLELAGFISIFTRIIFIFSEVIFITITFIWMRSKNNIITNIEKMLKSHKQEVILGLLVCVYITYFTIASFLRYDNFYTGRYDLGNMDQAVWNTINGRIFQGSSEDGAVISRLSAHADFMLVLISPLYLLWSHAKTLLITQTVILSLGGIFVFLIANHVLRNKNLALIFGSLYLFNPLIQFTNLYDFHAATFATTLLLASFYFLIKKKYFIMAAFLLLSGTTKEQVWTITSFFGLPLLLAKENKTKVLGFLITSLSIAAFVLLIWYIIPSNLGKEHFALSYFSDFGDSPTEVVKNTLFSPHKVIATIFSGSQLDYLRQIFMPLGFLSFLAPISLIFAIPNLLINLLSNNSQLHQIYYQYTSTITPFIFISAIYGVRQFIKWFPKIPIFYITIYLILFTAFVSYSYGPLPGAKNPNLAMFTRPHPNKEIIENFLSSIPKSYEVAATNNLGSHLSQRRILYTIPEGIDKADMILFLLNDGFAQPSLNSQKEMAENLKTDPDYKEVFKKDDFTVFRRKDLL